MAAAITNSENWPDFLIKSTLGSACIGLLTLVPFGILNFYQGRALLGVVSFSMSIFCAMNIYACTRKTYNPLINIFGLVPILVTSVVFVMLELKVTGTYWCYPALLCMYFVLPERLAWAANVVLVGIVVPLAWSLLDHAVVARFAATLVGVSVFAAVCLRIINRQHDLLQRFAVTDTLTGLGNRSRLQSSLTQAINEHQRIGAPMTLAMLDVDNFKAINDDRGHDGGDAVLRAIGKFLGKRFRGEDRVFRIGGEEFLVLLFNVDEQNGARIAEQLRGEIEHLRILPDLTVTVSIGVERLRSDVDWKTWMSDCDKKLYQAKAQGRNRVVV